MVPISSATSWKRLFIDRSSYAWVIIIIMVLIVLLSVFLTRLNATSIQKLMFVVLSLVSIWQMYRYKNIDLASLLIATLGLYILFAFNRSEVLPVIYLMIISGAMSALLTIWQGHGMFSKILLWRHAYLVGLFTAQLSALFAFWVTVDDTLAKAILTVTSLYVWWGILDLSSKYALNWVSIRGYLVLALLLSVAVLVTINPVQSMSIHR